MKRSKKVFWDSIRKNKIALILFAVMTLLNGAVFALYDIMAEGFIYSEILIFVIMLILLFADYLAEKRRAGERENCVNSILVKGYEKIENGSLADGDYYEMIKKLQDEIERLQTDFSQKKEADSDYYSAWVHQIKTPIAVMKLELSEDTPENRALLPELFRIEQYVEMVLDYIRLGSNSNDLVIKVYPLDEIIREALRKYAPQFVLRKLKLNYEPTDAVAVTDKKWLTFIIEQLISNAIKYTPEGEITVEAQNNQIRVSDTGIGIASEDLPRIFEKGYTGVNGRLGEKSSGLGLFLTKKAVDLISATIRCESSVGEGTCFTVLLPEK